MIGRCIPAGVFPDATTLATSSAYCDGFSSLYFCSNLRGCEPGYRGRRGGLPGGTSAMRWTNTLHGMTGVASLPLRGACSMKRLLTCVTLAACVFSAVAAAGLQQPVFRGGSDVVRVFVTVIDRDRPPGDDPDTGQLRGAGRGEAAADHPVRQHAAADPADRDARRVRQHGGQSAAAARRRRRSSLRVFGRRTWPGSVLSATRSPSVRRSPTTRASSARRCRRDRARCADAAVARDRRGARMLLAKEDDRRKVILVLSDGKDTGPIEFSSAPRRARPRSSTAHVERT